MESFYQKGCFLHYDETCIEIGNDLVSRKYQLKKGVLYTESITASVPSRNGDPCCWRGKSIPVCNFDLDMDSCNLESFKKYTYKWSKRISGPVFMGRQS
jgi:hypothetical protein